jgi:PIN domain nuclease of toxin-antitoxin system
MTNTRSFFAKVSAIACWGLCKRLYLESCFRCVWRTTHQESSIGLSHRAIESKTRRWGSEGDRACLALAIDKKVIVLTTNRVWANLQIGVDIQVIR